MKQRLTEVSEFLKIETDAVSWSKNSTISLTIMTAYQASVLYVQISLGT